ncbi:MAG TPA: carbohydrate ABC transporter permease [Thermococcus paralvinellae]|uniref:Carbohydrate ABC transporter permease n=1 Tax=Thermococcus paralvinellae TaxID=582419 RepID=A0A832ZGI5_9EURY|nr:carbohydrate ABC transporter permease [Thermococcus paralvinellae]
MVKVSMKYKVTINIVAWMIGIMLLIPLFGLIMASIRPFSEVVSGWWILKNAHFTLENYIDVLNRGFARNILNSIIIAGFATILPLLVSGMAAYGFTSFSFPVKTMLFLTLVAIQVVPQQAVIIPLLKLFRDLGLYNHMYGIILVHSAFALPWTIFFLRNFFMSIPKDYEEAAKIDGLSSVGIYFRIILPIALPAIISVAVVQFIFAWQDLFFAITLLRPENWPASAGITKFVSRYNPNWGQLTAAGVLTILVPLLVYITLQKYYMKGVSGGIKG